MRGLKVVAIGLTMMLFMVLAGGVNYVGGFSGSSSDEEETIFLKSGTFTPSPGVSSGARAHIMALGEEQKPRGHLIIQFRVIPDAQVIQKLEDLDAKALDYITGNAWFFSVPVSETLLDELAALPSFRSALEIWPEWKVDPSILERGVGEWARNPDGTLNLSIIFFKDTSLTDALQIVEQKGGTVVEESMEAWPTFNALTVKIPEKSQFVFIPALAMEDSVQWIDELTPVPEMFNDGIREDIGVEIVQTAPYNLDGAGVVICEWDGGWVDPTPGEHRDHPDLAGRVTIGDPNCTEPYCKVSPHATHVAGTMIGDGTLSEEAGGYPFQWRGMAPKASIISYEWWPTQSVGERNNVLEIHKEMYEEYERCINTYDGDLSSNSWGWGYESKDRNYGLYDEIAANLDAIVRGAFGKRIPIVQAAGNNARYKTINYPGNAKNVITVGATLSGQNNLCSFSSRGPTKGDGRLKPDIVAPGCQDDGDGGITSTCPRKSGEESYSYCTISGTSMAAPAVSGGVALLLQQYRLTFGKDDPLPSTVKALLIHTGEDLGNKGPDFSYGYGRVNIKGAVDVIRETPDRIIEDTIEETGEINTYAVRVSAGAKELRATLVWDDYPGSLNTSLSLVNDLDLEIVGPNGAKHYPWILDPDHRDLPARTGIDHRNNAEQVVVENPAPGEWQIRVKGYKIAAKLVETAGRLPIERGEVQDYSLIFSIDRG